jgi:transcriptional regulator with XRE-family HTH domain
MPAHHLDRVRVIGHARTVTIQPAVDAGAAAPNSSLRALRKSLAWSQERLISALVAEGGRQGVRVAGRESLKNSVSRWENAKQQPDEGYRRLLCAIFGVGEAELGFFPLLLQDEAPALGQVPGLESPLDIAGRMQRAARVNVDLPTATTLLDAVRVIVDRYEHVGQARLYPEAVRLRRAVDGLLQGHQHPRGRARLYEAAGKASGLLGYMAVNLGRLDLAQAYCAEAFQLADYADDKDLKAWVRGTQSFAAYYAGDYRAARDLARDGLRLAGLGPQAIRLSVNGEARALGQLGDRTGVDAAVEFALSLTAALGAPADMTSCISFGPYGTARVAANAATAYVALGDTARVLEFAQPLDAAVEAADSDWSRSLIRLDIATALATQASPEVDKAASLGLAALVPSARKPITSVRLRARVLASMLAPWREQPVVGELVEAVRAWRATPALRATA